MHETCASLRQSAPKGSLNFFVTRLPPSNRGVTVGAPLSMRLAGYVSRHSRMQFVIEIESKKIRHGRTDI